MTREDQVFVANVVVINITRKRWLRMSTCANVKFNTIAKIHKYKRLHERHHIIPMVMEVHDTPKCDMDHFIKECALLSHNRRSRDHLSLSFYIQFFKQRVSIALQYALTFAIERKIVLARDAYSKPLITFRSHNLHASDIKRIVGEITSNHERD
jgi:hypothetical protein